MDMTQIWNNIVAYSLQIGLVVGVAAALPAILRLKTPHARLLYWQLLLVACLTLPGLRPWHSDMIVVNRAPVFALPTAMQASPTVTVRYVMPPFVEIALWLLAAGFAVRLVWLALGLMKLSRYRRNGRAIPLPAEWTGAVGHATLLVSDEVPGPVTFGFFRPVVLLPANFAEMPAAMRDAILFHELVHVERRDWLYTLGEEILRAVFWFHPAIWWVLGEIQLAREQTVDRAVIEMTQASDPYVDTLLAMAGVNQQMDLAPAPLFLRRRHLKQRVMGIVQEAGMLKTVSKTRLMIVQLAALSLMAVACWMVTGAVPLQAQPQVVSDAAGVTVNANGTPVMHRPAVLYPGEALAKGVEGTVVAQVRLDAAGEVIDGTILSGPDELRRSVLQSVLTWHFDRSAGSSTRVVNIGFVRTVDTAAPMVVTSGQGSMLGGTSTLTTQARIGPAGASGLRAFADELTRAKAGLQDANDKLTAFKLTNADKLPPADSQIASQYEQIRTEQQAADQKYQDLLRRQQLKAAQDNLESRTQQQQLPLENGQLIQRFASDSGTIERIDVVGLSDSAKTQLLAQLPVHAGDSYSFDKVSRVLEAARQFDSHLTVSTSSPPSGLHVITIRPQQPSAFTPAATPGIAPPGAVRQGGNVAAANLISSVAPVYPPLAKMARQQGTVTFEATIGRDGTVEDLKVLSGPPLLIPSAIEAVKKWVYKPLLLNGAPVEVITTIDVTYTLAQ